MYWIKITEKSKNLPIEPYMFTDGVRIAIYHCSQKRRCYESDSMRLDEATHYILLKDLPLPEGIEDLVGEDAMVEIILGHYEHSVHKIGNILGPLIGTHKKVLDESGLMESLLQITRVNLESLGVIKDLKRLWMLLPKDPDEMD